MDLQHALAILGHPATLADAEMAAKDAIDRWSNILRLPGSNTRRLEAQQRMREIEEAIEVVRLGLPAFGTGARLHAPAPMPQPNCPPLPSGPGLGRRAALAVAQGIAWMASVIMPFLWRVVCALVAWVWNRKRVALPLAVAVLGVAVIGHYFISADPKGIPKAEPQSPAAQDSAGRSDAGPAPLGGPSPALPPPQAPAPALLQKSKPAKRQVSLPLLGSHTSMPTALPDKESQSESIGFVSIRAWPWGIAVVDGKEIEIPTASPIPLPTGSHRISVRIANASELEWLSVVVVPGEEVLWSKPKGCAWQSRAQRRVRK